MNAGYLLYGLHIALIFLLILLYATFPSLRLPLLALYIPIFLFHITARHCPLTKLERQLHGEDITVLDPILYIVGLPPTKQNRNGLQVIISSMLLGFFIWNVA